FQGQMLDNGQVRGVEADEQVGLTECHGADIGRYMLIHIDTAQLGCSTRSLIRRRTPRSLDSARNAAQVHDARNRLGERTATDVALTNEYKALHPRPIDSFQSPKDTDRGHEPVGTTAREVIATTVLEHQIRRTEH